MSLVSIIIPCYNQGRYLSAAIDSVLGQTHKNIEVIVVDDGSTDDTSQVAARYAAESRIRYVRQENRGPSAARNAGVAISKGEYVNFLDADDTLLPEKLERQLDILQADPALALVYCDIFYIDENGVDIPEKSATSIAQSRRILSGDIFDSLFIGGYFPPHTPLLRFDAYKQSGGFDQDLRGCCDWDLWLRIAANGNRAYYLNEKLAAYRMHGANMSNNFGHMRDEERRVIQKLTVQFPSRTADAYFALRGQLDELFTANVWMSKYIEKELVELRQRITALDGCPKFVRYPVYAVLIAIRNACLALKRILKY
jgi:glycosyltransferase involved in cell wall biosynthesis